MTYTPEHVHLVGSIGLPSVADVLFLGVVHARDGLEGLNARIAAASKYVPAFGIATECGMARARVPQVVQNILNIHAAGSHEPPP